MDPRTSKANRRPELFPLLLAAVLCGAPAPAQDRPSETAAAEGDEGRALYVLHCARCHGDSGKGDGPTKVYPPPRNFREGGFSFGNTEEAVVKTITSGIPGTTMASFRDQMDQRQRRLVAAYVLKFLPESARKPPADARVLVTDRARVVRGYLGPQDKRGCSTVQRGLGLGLPGGFSLYYRTGDVRLLEVRRGGFVERTDWRGRGGTPLKRLGKVFWRWHQEELASFVLVGGRRLRARPSGSRTGPAMGEIGYSLMDGDREAARVVERVKVETVRGGTGVTRALTYETASPVLLGLPGRVASWKLGFPHDAPLGEPVALGPQEDVDPTWLVSPHSGGFQALVLRGPRGGFVSRVGSSLVVTLPPARSAVLQISLLLLPAFDEEIQDTLNTDLM